MEKNEDYNVRCIRKNIDKIRRIFRLLKPAGYVMHQQFNI